MECLLLCFRSVFDSDAHIILRTTSPLNMHTREKLLSWGTFGGQEASKLSQEGWMTSREYKGRDAESGPAGDRACQADLACCIGEGQEEPNLEVSSLLWETLEMWTWLEGLWEDYTSKAILYGKVYTASLKGLIGYTKIQHSAVGN